MERFNEAEIMASRIFKALSHPARVAILRVLAEKRTCICGEIVDELPLAQSTVSQHLKALKEAGLVQGTVEGPAVCYCINMKELRTASEKLSQLFTSLIADTDCC